MSRWTKNVLSPFQAFHDQIIIGCSFSAPPQSIFLTKSFEQQVQVTRQEFVFGCVKDEVVLYLFNKCMSPKDNCVYNYTDSISLERVEKVCVGGMNKDV